MRDVEVQVEVVCLCSFKCNFYFILYIYITFLLGVDATYASANVIPQGPWQLMGF